MHQKYLLLLLEIGGVVQGTVKQATGQNPIIVSIYPSTILISGVITKGIPKIGFNTSEYQK